MMFKAPTQFTLFKQRRQLLIEKIKSEYGLTKGAIIVSAGFEVDRYAFRQESSFYYLTGIIEPAMILIIYLDGKEILYIPRFSTPRTQWVQVMINGPEDAKKIDVDEIRYLGSDIPGYSFQPIFTQEKYAAVLNDLSEYLDSNTTVFTLLDQTNQNYFMNVNLFHKFQLWLPALQTSVVDFSPILNSIRRVKDEYEIDLIYKAVQITNMAHKAAAALIAPGKYEYEIQAGIESVFTHIAGASPSFPSIIAAGKNTTILHYTQRSDVLNDGDLVVVDIGAEYGFYAADLTRTFPVNGTFSARQRQVYQAVLDTQTYIETLAVPGMFLKNPKQPEKSLHHLAIAFLDKKGFAKYFCHGIGHYLGLDVHDVGDYSIPLQPGDVFTIEPGIYIADENLGVRIEDDYIMADDGAVCLSFELPKQLDQVELLMRQV